MRISQLSIVLAFVLAFSIQSCDKIDPPYVRGNGNVNDTTDTLKRVILLEEFTGHKCPNCPTGSLIAHGLKEEHPDQVVLISVHSGVFATADGSGDFTYDFRNPTGNALDQFFHVGDWGYPNALVSRIPYNDTRWVVSPQYWEEMSDTLLDDKPVATLSISTTYVSSSRQVNATVAGKFLGDSDKTYNIVLYITEDSIVKPQKNNNPNLGPEIIPDYVHMNVLRGGFNGTWGDELMVSPSENETFSRNFSRTLDNGWDENHCKVVAFIYETTSLEVMQAAEKTIK